MRKHLTIAGLLAAAVGLSAASDALAYGKYSDMQGMLSRNQRTLWGNVRHYPLGVMYANGYGKNTPTQQPWNGQITASNPNRITQAFYRYQFQPNPMITPSFRPILTPDYRAQFYRFSPGG